MNETSDHALDFGREVITAILSVGCTGWRWCPADS